MLAWEPMTIAGETAPEYTLIESGSAASPNVCLMKVANCSLAAVDPSRAWKSVGRTDIVQLQPA